MLTGRADFFWYTWNRKAPQRKGEQVEASIEVTPEVAQDINRLMEAWKAQAGTTGSHHTTGIFQIQTDYGIWQREDGASFTKRVTTAQFKSWEQLEAEEIPA
jgi:hypothetical protein